MITVYFMHITLTPDNIRETWKDSIAVPRVGDWVTLSCGYQGARVVWEVRRVEWNGPRSVTCYMSGPEGRVDWEQRQNEARAILAEVA